jgi:hypothetical protein
VFSGDAPAFPGDASVKTINELQRVATGTRCGHFPYDNAGTNTAGNRAVVNPLLLADCIGIPSYVSVLSRAK